MPQRKGQFIVNHFRHTLKIPEESIGRVLFNYTDELFEDIERAYRFYVIKEIHKPERQASKEDMEMLQRNLNTIVKGGEYENDEHG